MNTPIPLRKAFTLVELLVVVLVIAVLAAIAIPQFVNAGLRSKESSLMGDLKLLRNGVQLFVNDTGVYPASLAALAVTTAPATGYNSAGTSTSITAANYKGPYIETIPTDPVSGNAFTYSIASPTVGTVTSSATGNSLSGTAYSTW